MTQNFMIVFEAHAEHGVGQKLHHLAAHLEKFFFRHQSSKFLRAQKVLGAIAAAARKGKRRTDGAARRARSLTICLAPDQGMIAERPAGEYGKSTMLAQKTRYALRAL